MKNCPFIDDLPVNNDDFPQLGYIVPLNYCNVSADLWLGLRVQVDTPYKESHFAGGQDLNVFRVAAVSVTSGRMHKQVSLRIVGFRHIMGESTGAAGFFIASMGISCKIVP